MYAVFRLSATWNSPYIIALCSATSHSILSLSLFVSILMFCLLYSQSVIDPNSQPNINNLMLKLKMVSKYILILILQYLQKPPKTLTIKYEGRNIAIIFISPYSDLPITLQWISEILIIIYKALWKMQYALIWVSWTGPPVGGQRATQRIAGGNFG